MKDGSNKAASKSKAHLSGKLSGLVHNSASSSQHVPLTDTSGSTNLEKSKNLKHKKTSGSQFTTFNKTSQSKTLSSFQIKTWVCVWELLAVMGISKCIQQKIHWNSENGVHLTVLKWILWVSIVYLGVKIKWKWMRPSLLWDARVLRNHSNVFWLVWKHQSRKKSKSSKQDQQYHLSCSTNHLNKNNSKNWQ